MFNESIIKITGQWWKASIFFWGVVVGATIMFVGLANLQATGLATALVITGIVVGMASFIFACVSIRCPHCNVAWLWQGMSGKSHNEWLHCLLKQSRCPHCNK